MGGILATGSTAPTVSTFSSAITALVDVGKDLLGLVTEFPLNIFMASGIIAIGFGIIRRAKRSVA